MSTACSIAGCEVSALEGSDGQLEAISCRDRKSGNVTRREVRYLFSFIGAEPNTDWLRASGISLDTRGFVLVGEEAGDYRLPLETTRNGIFAVGDVRSTSVKRVAASVGDVPTDQIVCYCGSGVTACHNLIAFEHAGLTGAKLYAGSWSEWSADGLRPIEKG